MTKRMWGWCLVSAVVLVSACSPGPDDVTDPSTPAADNFTVAGNVSGMLGGSLVLQLSGGRDLTITANGAFQFSGTLTRNSIVLVTVRTQPAGQACVVGPDGNGAITRNVTNITVVCVPTPPVTYSVEGNVTGLTNTPVVLQLNGADDITVLPNTNVPFEFPEEIPSGTAFAVTVFQQPVGLRCTVVNGSGVIAADVTNVNVNCVAVAAGTFTVGGNVTGLSNAGLVLQNIASDNRIINANGIFRFATPDATGAAYAVSILAQPTGQTCTLNNASGTIATAHIVNIGVSCSTGPASGSRVTKMAIGGRHACAILVTGVTKCWGENELGQLGLGDTSDRGAAPNEMGANLPAVNFGTGRTAVDIVLGVGHGCARLDNNTLKCWGDNLSGQLGLGDTNDRGDSPGEMGDNLPAINLGTGRHAVELAVGLSHTCARLDNNTVKCWGLSVPYHYPLNPLIGNNAGEMGDVLPVIDFGTGLTATHIVAGSDFTCARLNTGQVKCWGLGMHGVSALGQGRAGGVGSTPAEMGNALQPVALGAGRTALKLTAGINHVCALLDNSTTKCWGNNSAGQLGLGDTIERGDGPNEMGDFLLPVNLGAARTATQLAVAGVGSCALLDNSSVKCWGSWLSSGSEGTQNFGDQGSEMGDFLPVVRLGSSLTAVDLVGGGVAGYVCTRFQNDRVKCWGDMVSGHFYNGNTGNVLANKPGDMGDNLPFIDLGP